MHRYGLLEGRLSIESSRTLLEIVSAFDSSSTVRTALPTPQRAHAQYAAGVQPLDVATLLLPTHVSAPHARPSWSESRRMPRSIRLGCCSIDPLKVSSCY